jgi:hypothetical protein
VEGPPHGLIGSSGPATADAIGQEDRAEAEGWIDPQRRACKPGVPNAEADIRVPHGMSAA